MGTVEPIFTVLKATVTVPSFQNMSTNGEKIDEVTMCRQNVVLKMLAFDVSENCVSS